MAKITTITNPLTGQPTQVDQLDHTAQQIDDSVKRALEYGLGAVSKQLTSDDDIDTIFQNGWYMWGDIIPKNAPITGKTTMKNYAFMRVSNYSRKDVLQEFWNLNDDAKYKSQRIIRNGVPQPLEWVNAPMESGFEYRTTERWNGMPVYAKLIYGGKSAAGGTTEIPYGVTVSRLIEQVITVGVIQQPFAITDNNYKVLVDACGHSNVTVETGTSMGDRDIYVRIKYTK